MDERITVIKFTRKFRVKHDEAWAWHIGAFLCIEPKHKKTGKRDIYLFFCIGRHDFSIGMLTEPELDEID